MNKLNTKKFHIINRIFSISEIGFVILFFLLPYIAVASPISKELILKLTNNERTNQNLALLQQNPILEQVAQNKAQDIMKKQYFAHTNPEGKPFYKWVDESGYNYAYAGENLAIDFEEAEDAMTAWMESPKHRENILNQNYSDMGVGVLNGIFEGHPSTIIVQIFGQPFMQINKLDKYNSLEEQTYSTLIKGDTKDNKAITDVPMKNENGFMLNTPLTLGNTDTIETYDIENEPQTPTSTTPAKTKKIADANNLKLSLSQNNNLSTSNELTTPSFDLFLVIVIFIIILSVYGSILENIKKSFHFHSHKSQTQ